MHRISIVGSSGSGKTRLATTVAATLGIPLLELDAIYHQASWTPLEREAFLDRVTQHAQQPTWVIDGNYSSHGVLDVVWKRADTVIWLDPPKRTVMWRVTTRTLRRIAMRIELWNGNRERWANLFARQPAENIVLWAWTRFGATRAKYEARMRDPRWCHLTVYRLETRAQHAAFLARLRTRGGPCATGDRGRQR